MAKEKSVKKDPIEEDYYVSLVKNAYENKEINENEREQIYVVSHKKLSDDEKREEKLGMVSMLSMCLKTAASTFCFIKSPGSSAGTALCICGLIDMLIGMIFGFISEKSEKKVKKIEEIKASNDSKNEIPQDVATTNDGLGIEI